MGLIRQPATHHHPCDPARYISPCSLPYMCSCPKGQRKKDLQRTHPGPQPHHPMHATSVARLFSPPLGEERSTSRCCKRHSRRAATSFLLLLVRAFSWPLHMEWIDPSEPGPFAGRRAAVSLTRVRPLCSGIRANLSLHQMPPFSFDRAGGACRGDRTAAATAQSSSLRDSVLIEFLAAAAAEKRRTS